MNNQQDIAVLEKLIEVFDRLNIAYVIGGSIASSVYGEVRFTQDADITVEPFGLVAERLFDELKGDFYISNDAMNEALQSKSSFNVIHLETAFKIDIFIRQESEFQKQLLLRSRKLQLKNSSRTFVFVSPEDIILLKLDWYRQSDCSSERQLSDVLGVLAVQREHLDFNYLRGWAAKMGLSELLQKAVSEARQ